MNQHNRVEIGGFTQYTTNQNTYLKCLRSAARCHEKGRKLVTQLLSHICSEFELSTQNATGKTKGNAKFGKLDPLKLEALFQQAKMQFPEFNDLSGTLNAINNICKKIRNKLSQVE